MASIVGGWGIGGEGGRGEDMIGRGGGEKVS